MTQESTVNVSAEVVIGRLRVKLEEESYRVLILETMIDQLTQQLATALEQIDQLTKEADGQAQENPSPPAEAG